ncbi:hypothetical protein HG536_0H01350 [Torulaspora globosa]|uniref:Cns1/TTC4 wheel domain-containing protein n=1 Tax=Torulaspora globosa TaxID=48254 RepID=A0A7G3ZMM4_9SACH|nr:uncharacterized protein HG536_0H01350 [Torulaspora globosa]QLL34760.1 hypothetical protein HG536_0H01350 [Torulaspora globosa]
MVETYKKPQRYVPGPNDPALPPQLSEFQNKTTDEVLEELNRMPFFMTKLDNTDGEGGENKELEALKALAYEGEPHEIAENFKNQGNELFKCKRFKDARELYTKGIEVDCNDARINDSLYANRAACELEVKNYRKCLTDCKAALQFNPKNLKCYYRMGKAFLAINKLEESRESVEFGLQIDSSNKSLKNLLDVIAQKQEEVELRKVKNLQEQRAREGMQVILDNAMKLRKIINVKTHAPPDIIRDCKIALEDPFDYESQLIYPALILYPTTDQFDFVAEVGELTSVQELLSIIMDRPEEWFKAPGHENFSAKKLVVYMETNSGGLVKIGKKITFHDVLKMEKPKIPLFDNALKVYFVPKTESEEWVQKWDKSRAIEKRLISSDQS